MLDSAARPRAVLARILFVSSLLLTFASTSIPAKADGPPPREIYGELDNLTARYSLEVITTDVSLPVTTRAGVISGAVGDKAELAKYVPLFAEEFCLYPLELVKRSRLKRIVLCKDLAFAGQRRNSVPDFGSHCLYLDVARGIYSQPYMRKVIHHDYFHMIDLQDDRSLYADPAWCKLNPADFKYGLGGKNAQDLASTSILTDAYPGFLNHYSTTGVEEDKAEIFANLVVDPAYVENRAKSESVLNAKVEFLRQSLSQFCPEMNDRFWEKVRQARQAGP